MKRSDGEWRFACDNVSMKVRPPKRAGDGCRKQSHRDQFQTAVDWSSRILLLASGFLHTFLCPPRHQMEMEDGGIGIGPNPGALVEEEYGDSTRSETRPTRFQIMERELPTSRMHHKTNLFIPPTLSITDLPNTTPLLQFVFQSFHFLSIFECPEVIISDGQCMLKP